jgi:hypothetical protein
VRSSYRAGEYFLENVLKQKKIAAAAEAAAAANGGVTMTA